MVAQPNRVQIFIWMNMTTIRKVFTQTKDKVSEKFNAAIDTDIEPIASNLGTGLDHFIDRSVAAVQKYALVTLSFFSGFITLMALRGELIFFGRGEPGPISTIPESIYEGLPEVFLFVLILLLFPIWVGSRFEVSRLKNDIPSMPKLWTRGAYVLRLLTYFLVLMFFLELIFGLWTLIQLEIYSLFVTQN